MAEIRGSFGGNDGKWGVSCSSQGGGDSVSTGVELCFSVQSTQILSFLSSKAHCQLYLWDPNHWAQSDCLRRSGEFHLGALQKE